MRFAFPRMRFFPAVAYLALAWLMTACGTVLIDPKVPPFPPADFAPEMYHPPVQAEYHIQPGDRLSLRSYFDQQLNQDVVVRRDGRISLLLLGDHMVAGKTPEEMSKFFTEEYTKRIPTAEVTVAVVDAVTPNVYVGGEVSVAAQQTLSKPLTVIQAITAAGGFRQTANSRQVIVLRHQADDRFVAYQIDAQKVLINAAADVYLQPYDVVFVPMTRIAHIDRFVSQYINQLIPEALRFNASYSWINDLKGSTPSQIQVIQP